MKIVLIGGVSSTLVALEGLSRHGFEEVTVFGYRPADNRNVSGWTDLEGPAAARGYAHLPFQRINDHVEKNCSVCSAAALKNRFCTKMAEIERAH